MKNFSPKVSLHDWFNRRAKSLPYVHTFEKKCENSWKLYDLSITIVQKSVNFIFSLDTWHYFTIRLPRFWPHLLTLVICCLHKECVHKNCETTSVVKQFVRSKLDKKLLKRYFLLEFKYETIYKKPFIFKPANACFKFL